MPWFDIKYNEIVEFYGDIVKYEKRMEKLPRNLK